MRRFVLGLFVVAPLCAISSGAAAQETSHPMYLIRQEFVRPAQMADYEAETRRWLAGIDHVRSRLSTSRSDAPGRWSSSAGSVPTPIDHSESYVVELRPDLSYLPRTVELDLTLPFRKYHWYHTIPGREGKFEDIATRLVALYAEHGIEDGYRFYELILGSELPVYLMVQRAHDEADYAARTARIRATVGGGGADALVGQFLQFTRKVEVMEGMTRGDLSHPPLIGPPRVGGLDAGRQP